MTELRAGMSLGGWTIVRPLASGGMGAVYVAQNSLSGVVRALKIVRPDLVASEDTRQRFLREVALASRVRHPNVVEAYDPLEIDGRILLPMELLEGETLAARLRRGPLEIGEAIELGMVLARAVAAFHAVGIIHRDLKPANVFLARDAQGAVTPKILDLGAAREIEGPKHTQTGHTIGSPSYMAPEQARGERDLDGRVDVYALGVVLYVALTCTRPVESDTEGNAIAKLVQGAEIVPPRHHRPEIPAALEAVVMRALAWDRAQRLASADALAHALEEVRRGAARPATDAPSPTSVASAPIVAPPVQVATAPAVRSRAPMAFAVVLAAGLLGLATFAFGAVWYASPSRAPAHEATSAPAQEISSAAPPLAAPPAEPRSVEPEPDAGAAPVTVSASPAVDAARRRTEAPSRRPRSRPTTSGPDEPEPASGAGLWLEDP